MFIQHFLSFWRNFQNQATVLGKTGNGSNMKNFAQNKSLKSQKKLWSAKIKTEHSLIEIDENEKVDFKKSVMGLRPGPLLSKDCHLRITTNLKKTGGMLINASSKLFEWEK